jgi:dTDP-4-amino-4,6-dideoxygalactose transaminase
LTEACTRVASLPSQHRVVSRHPVPGPHNQQAGLEAPSLHCLLDAPGTTFTTSGRAAILLGLEALTLAPQDRVLVPTYHCPTMVSPVLALGRQVGFYPIAADGRPDMDWLAQHAPADTRVLCVAHFFGLPLDLRNLRAWCEERGVLLLEDCAHAMFGHGPGGKVGALGDVVIASLPKFFATQDGGLLRVSRPVPALRRPSLKAELKNRLNALEASARFGRLGRWRLWAAPLLAAQQALRGKPAAPAPAAAAAAPAGFDPDSDYARVDPALAHQAATKATVRTALTSTRSRVVARRREHYAHLATALSGQPGMRPLFPALPNHCAPYVFPLWVDQPDPLYQQLRTLGVPVSRWDWLWPGTPDLPGDHGKTWSTHVLQLHCHQDMSDADRAWVIATLLSHCTG